MANKKDEDLITQAEAAELRGVTPQAINELVRRGRLTMVKRFGLQLVYRSEVKAFEPKTHKARAAKKGKGKK